MINESLQQFKEGWNNHKIRTEHNRSPNQLLFVYSSVDEAIEIPIVDEEDIHEDDAVQTWLNSEEVLNQHVLNLSVNYLIRLIWKHFAVCLLPSS
jgi:hypothetical protein